MKMKMQIQQQIAKPAHEVFNAIVDQQELSGYFIIDGKGRMEEGKTITWRWEDYNGTIDIHIKRIEKDKFISFNWSGSGTETTVEIHFEEHDGITTAKIREYGWDKDDNGIARLVEQTQGWTQMLCCLKAYLEYGINLRTVKHKAAS